MNRTSLVLFVLAFLLLLSGCYLISLAVALIVLSLGVAALGVLHLELGPREDDG